MKKQMALSALLLAAALLALPGVGAAAESEVVPGAGPGDAPAAASGQRVSGPETNKPTEELVFLTWPDYIDPTLVRSSSVSSRCGCALSTSTATTPAIAS